MCREAWKDKTSQKSTEAAPRTSHQLSRFQVFFTKICQYYYCLFLCFVTTLVFKVCPQFEFLSFVTN